MKPWGIDGTSWYGRGEGGRRRPEKGGKGLLNDRWDAGIPGIPKQFVRHREGADTLFTLALCTAVLGGRADWLNADGSGGRGESAQHNGGVALMAGKNAWL